MRLSSLHEGTWSLGLVAGMSPLMCVLTLKMPLFLGLSLLEFSLLNTFCLMQDWTTVKPPIIKHPWDQA